MKNTDLEPKNFGQDELEEIKNKICKKFDQLHEERRAQLSHIKRVRNAIFGEHSHLGSSKTLNLPDAWEQASTLKAHLLEAISSHPEGLFDVSEADNSNSQSANKHKIFLCNALEKMKFSDKLEQIIDELIETGEITLFVGWETRWRKKRIATTLYDKIQNPLSEPFKTVEEKTYEGASLKIIGAHDFVFDTQRVQRWDNCPKIHRSWMEINEIFENKDNFIISHSAKEELINKLERTKKDKDTSGITDGLVEVLKYWGNIRLESGQILKNRLIVVIGRIAVVQNEPNPYVCCPYIHANLIRDPGTKRGLSPLSPILPILEATSEIMQTQILGHKLVSNPPFLAPRGAFHGQIDVRPGKIIEYDPTLLPQMPQPLNFSQIFTGWDFIKFFKGQIERATGIFDNMSGQINQQGRTATELNYSANGQSARLNWFIDSINRKIIIPLLEKVAQTNANFLIGETRLTTEVKGESVTIEITPDIKEGNYVYRYSDRKANATRNSKQREVERAISEFAKIPSLADKINWDECFKYALSGLGVENTEKFLQNNTSLEVKGNEIQTP